MPERYAGLPRKWRGAPPAASSRSSQEPPRPGIEAYLRTDAHGPACASFQPEKLAAWTSKDTPEVPNRLGGLVARFHLTTTLSSLIMCPGASHCLRTHGGCRVGWRPASLTRHTPMLHCPREATTGNFRHPVNRSIGPEDGGTAGLPPLIPPNRAPRMLQLAAWAEPAKPNEARGTAPHQRTTPTRQGKARLAGAMR